MPGESIIILPTPQIIPLPPWACERIIFESSPSWADVGCSLTKKHNNDTAHNVWRGRWSGIWENSEDLQLPDQSPREK